MLKIRLTRIGKKNSPYFRVVVAEQKKAVMRKFIEIVGNYNPSLKPKQLVINNERVLYWMGQGAQPSDTVRNLMCRLDILPATEKVKKVFGKPTKKKDAKNKTEEPVVKPETEAPEEKSPEAETAEIETAEAEVAPEEPEIAPEANESEVASPESVESEVEPAPTTDEESEETVQTK